MTLFPIDQTRFLVSHWLVRMGLGNLFPLPVDLGELEIAFFVGEDSDQAMSMIIDIEGFAYEICPRYPEITDIPALWEALSGQYELVVRLPSGRAGNEDIGRDEIRIEGGVLVKMPKVLYPVNDTEVIIQERTVCRRDDALRSGHRHALPSMGCV